MLKEIKHVSKWADPIFDEGVADLSSLPGMRSDLVQTASVQCIQLLTCRGQYWSFHDQYCIFTIRKLLMLHCRIISRYGKSYFILKDAFHKLLILNEQINILYKT